MKGKLLMCGALCALLLSSCDKEEVDKQEPIVAETVSDLPAAPTDQENDGGYTFFSFSNGIVDKADSASVAWDIAFRSTSIIVNNGISGPGETQLGIVDGIFSEIGEVPAAVSWKSDASAESMAVPSGSGNGWYAYNPTNHEISPIAGKVFLVKTNAGNYAKFEILSYYKGAPTEYDISIPGRYYTFRYVYQPNGSMNFE